MTVAPELLRAVDAFVDAHPGLDRSKVLDDALALWYERQRKQAMVEQFEAKPSGTEQDERAAWKRTQRAAVARRFGPR